MAAPVRKANAANLGWAVLGSYVFIWDLLGYKYKFELLTDGWRRWLSHPKKRWVIGAAWLLTTKHLFFGSFVRWLDPFHIIGLSFRLFDKNQRSTQHAQSTHSSSKNVRPGVHRTHSGWVGRLHLSWRGFDPREFGGRGSTARRSVAAPERT